MHDITKFHKNLDKISRIITIVFVGVTIPFLPIILAFFIPNITLSLVDGPLVLCCEYDASDAARAAESRPVAQAIIRVCLLVLSLVYILLVFAVTKSSLYKGETIAKILFAGLTAISIVLFCAAASDSYPVSNSDWWDFVWRGWWF